MVVSWSQILFFIMFKSIPGLCLIEFSLDMVLIWYEEKLLFSYSVEEGSNYPDWIKLQKKSCLFK